MAALWRLTQGQVMLSLWPCRATHQYMWRRRFWKKSVSGKIYNSIVRQSRLNGKVGQALLAFYDVKKTCKKRSLYRVILYHSIYYDSSKKGFKGILAFFPATKSVRCILKEGVHCLCFYQSMCFAPTSRRVLKFKRHGGKRQEKNNEKGYGKHLSPGI